MKIDGLDAQLEHLFTAEQLVELAETLLELPADHVCKSRSPGAFARALVARCETDQILEALVEAARLMSPEHGSEFAARCLRARLPNPEQLCAQLGDYALESTLDDSGRVFTAALESRRVRVKVYPTESKTAARLAVSTRFLAQQGHPHEVRVLPGATAVVTPHVDGQLLPAAIFEGDPGITARRVARALLEALEPLHAAGAHHGNLCPNNILLATDNAMKVVLLDAGGAAAGGPPALPHVRHVGYCAPECLLGHPPSPSSDIYAVGALVYELLTGRPPFGERRGLAAATPILWASSALSGPPLPPSSLASTHIDEALDRWVLSLLEPEPAQRPNNAASALLGLAQLHERVSQRPPMPAEHLEELIAALLEAPDNHEAAVALEAAIDRGAAAERVAEAFDAAFERLDSDAVEAKLDLAFRAGRLHHGRGDDERAERSFERVLALRPDDPVAIRGLEVAQVRLGKAEAVIESWLEKIEAAGDAEIRADAWLHIARLYEEQLDDPEQALLAQCQAFVERPGHEEREGVERLADARPEAWNEVAESCWSQSAGDLPTEHKVQLLGQLGRWYLQRLKRPDLALSCYQTLLPLDPGNEPALDAVSGIYRRAQQWPELVVALARQAEAAPTAAAARELRFAMAEVQLQQLSDAVTARSILEGILEQDPAHTLSNELLGKLLREAGDHKGYAALLERWANAADRSTRLTLLCRAAGVHEAHLGSAADALKLYRTVAAEEPSHLGALRGLDRLHGVLGQFDELLANLQEQLRVSATPRQKLELYARIAALYEEEFLSPSEAIAALEAMLELDPRHDAAHRGLARAYERLERWPELSDALARHAQILSDPKRKRNLLTARAQLLEERLHDVSAAIECYEQVLVLVPQDTTALSALVKLRQEEGDATAALKALDQLVTLADEPAKRVDGLRQSAELLSARGELAEAAKRWEQALELQPTLSEGTEKLGELYRKLGRGGDAAKLLQRAAQATTGLEAQAALLARAATILSGETAKGGEAKTLACEALELDADNLEALQVLLRAHIDEKSQSEVAAAALRLLPHAAKLDVDTARELFAPAARLTVDTATDTALALWDVVLERLPEDRELEWEACEAWFRYGAPDGAESRLAQQLERFDGSLSPSQEAIARYRHAELVRRQGDVERAEQLLTDVRNLDGKLSEPVHALALLAETREAWERALELYQELLTMVDEAERVSVHVRMGEIAADKLQDAPRAAQSYVAALELHPEDRNLLARLMQLYSAGKDWEQLVSIVLKLADFQDDALQRSKYLMTAAMVCVRELERFEQALELFELVSELDPSNAKATRERLSLYLKLEKPEKAEALLRACAEAASAANDKPRLTEVLVQLADLFRDLGRTSEEADALAAARKAAPDDASLLARLTELYREHSERYFERGLALQQAVLERDPYRPEAYRALRKLYTKSKKADGAWCLCQALSALNLAEPDEEKFFTRMRSEEPAHAKVAATDADWGRLIHSSADARLTRVFALLENAIVNALGGSLDELGYSANHELHLARHQFPVGQMLHYAAGVLALAAPPTFENSNDPEGLRFLRTRPCSLSIGHRLLTHEIQAQELAFECGRMLTYYRPGFLLRTFGEGASHLKIWLFAALRIASPTFPVAPEIEGEVAQAQMALENTLTTEVHVELRSLVATLLVDSQALDLKRWVEGVDYTADRAGFILANDLQRSLARVRDQFAVVSTPGQQRARELLLFAISPAYFELRSGMGLGLS